MQTFLLVVVALTLLVLLYVQYRFAVGVRDGVAGLQAGSGLLGALGFGG